MKSKSTMPIIAALWLSILPLSLPIAAQQHQHETPQNAPPFKMSTELVSLSVMVTDRKGEAITGLNREDFKVYENGIEQALDFFSTEEMPVCWGIVLDRSGSMAEMIRDVYRAAVHVVDEGTQEDEAFVVTFNNKTELVTDFVSNKNRLQNSILGLRADGGTALWDAVDFALDHLRQARHRKKVLVVITDGEDNRSRISFRGLMARAKEENVLIYTVGMFESGRMSSLGMDGSYFGMGARGSDPRGDLEKLAQVTGARAHFPTNAEQCREAMQAIAGEVGHQYSLGYYPNNPRNDGRWRKIQVVTGQSEGKDGYVVRTRAGYHAPKGEEAK